ncbi:MAG: glycerate kinase [Anaerolineae bacterium]|nr:glycerate kinase [Anaerolineae bacterium]
MNILVAPNAFKGALSAMQAADAIARGLRRSGLACALDLMPIADGGDDTMDVLTVQGGQVHAVTVEGPLGRPVTAAWGLLADGQTAVVEMARASGLKLLRDDERDPLRTSTYGTGQLIAAAVAAGANRIIVGVGGSATVDGGAGCAHALGVRLLDASGQTVPRGGGALGGVRTIDMSGLLEPLRMGRVQVQVACDVENPTLGPTGAVAVFGPQKGATPAQVELLESNLRHFFTLVAEQVGVDVRDLVGGGAAGALSAGLAAFLGAELQSGIDLVLDALGFAERLVGVDLVITGEGRMDSQTLGGKGPFGVALAARARGIPAVALAGGLGDGEDALLDAGLAAILPVAPGPIPLAEALADADELLERAANRLGRLLALGGALAV